MVDLNIKLPDGFLDEEVRCGYTVTKQMKEVWAVELDLLDKLLSVCKKYNIKIFASDGTLLGAARHKGMIPWDDDIDMSMFRKDYTKLCKVAESEFKYPYFFQTEYTDPGTLRGHAQLRNSCTTGILALEKGKRTFNQGIFIDIFPLDAVIDDKYLFEQQCKKIAHYKYIAFKLSKLSSCYKKGETVGAKGVCKNILHLCTCDIIKKLRLEQWAYKKFEAECQKYNNINTEKISALSFGRTDKRFFEFRVDFKEIIMASFEFMEIPIVKNYDRVLRQLYGDYMVFVKGKNCHGKVLFDTCNSYNKYLSL